MSSTYELNTGGEERRRGQEENEVLQPPDLPRYRGTLGYVYI